VYNNVMVELTNAAGEIEDTARFMERWPAPIRSNNVDMKGVKSKQRNAVEDSDMTEADKELAFGIIDGLDDVITQFTRGIAFGDTVTVMKGGKPEFWKINDPLLFRSITDMRPRQASAILAAYGRITRLMSSMITGNNLIWALGSNFPRDIMTMYGYSPNKNPLRLLAGMYKSYRNAFRDFRGKETDPEYKRFVALGGATNATAYTADANLAKRALKKIRGKRWTNYLNIFDDIEFIADTVETGPRYAVYLACLKMGMTPEEAVYASHEATVDFRRGGPVARELAKIIPFFNASIQGTDRFVRWTTAEDAPKGERVKTARNRFLMYLTISAALGAIAW
jgi:hypothetical protein